VSASTWTDYLLAGDCCPATAEQLRDWCEQTGGTLTDAVALADVGALRVSAP
jgi:hypothetical protein